MNVYACRALHARSACISALARSVSLCAPPQIKSSEGNTSESAGGVRSAPSPSSERRPPNQGPNQRSVTKPVAESVTKSVSVADSSQISDRASDRGGDQISGPESVSASSLRKQARPPSPQAVRRQCPALLDSFAPLPTPTDPALPEYPSSWSGPPSLRRQRTGPSRLNHLRHQPSNSRLGRRRPGAGSAAILVRAVQVARTTRGRLRPHPSPGRPVRSI